MSKQTIAVRWHLNGRSGTATARPGQTLYQLLPQIPADETPQMPIVAAMVGNLLKDLSYPIFADTEITWLDGTTPIGRRIL